MIQPLWRVVLIATLAVSATHPAVTIDVGAAVLDAVSGRGQPMMIVLTPPAPGLPHERAGRLLS